MSEAETKKAWKQTAAREMAEYFSNFFYLVFLFGSLEWHKRLVLADYNIRFGDYGVAIIEAAILAKVIMIGGFLRIGRRFEDRPLIYPTLVKAMGFAAWFGLFKLVEDTVRGIFHGEGFKGAIDAIMKLGDYRLLALCLVTFFAFIPFFAFKELTRVFGEAKTRRMFFKERNMKSEVRNAEG